MLTLNDALSYIPSKAMRDALISVTNGSTLPIRSYDEWDIWYMIVNNLFVNQRYSIEYVINVILDTLDNISHKSLQAELLYFVRKLSDIYNDFLSSPSAYSIYVQYPDDEVFIASGTNVFDILPDATEEFDGILRIYATREHIDHIKSCESIRDVYYGYVEMYMNLEVRTIYWGYNDIDLDDLYIPYIDRFVPLPIPFNEGDIVKIYRNTSLNKCQQLRGKVISSPINRLYEILWLLCDEVRYGDGFCSNVDMYKIYVEYTGSEHETDGYNIFSLDKEE